MRRNKFTNQPEWLVMSQDQSTTVAAEIQLLLITKRKKQKPHFYTLPCSVLIYQSLPDMLQLLQYMLQSESLKMVSEWFGRRRHSMSSGSCREKIQVYRAVFSCAARFSRTSARFLISLSEARAIFCLFLSAPPKHLYKHIWSRFASQFDSRSFHALINKVTHTYIALTKDHMITFC